MKALKSEELSTAASAIGCSEDLLPEILFRLPARDLIRLKSVSPRWNRIISNPLFAARHTQTTHLGLPAGAIFYDHFRSSRPFTAVPVQKVGNPPSNVPSLSFMRNIIADFDYRWTSIHSCNGLLLCLFSLRYVPVLDLQSLCFVCNPTTRDFKLLPLPPYLKANECFVGLTLAFNPSETLHYKVIGIKKWQNQWCIRNQRVPELHIYSSETNSWKFGSFMEEGFKLNSYGSGVLLNDRVYWVGRHQIHYYGVHSEEVGSICSPVVEYSYPCGIWGDMFLVTLCGRLYSMPRCCSGYCDYRICEFDSTTRRWSVRRMEVFDSKSKVVPRLTSLVFVARGDEYDDFVLLFGNKFGLIIFDLVLGKYVRHSHYPYGVCQYIPSLATV